jgi:hypothetical protein
MHDLARSQPPTTDQSDVVTRALRRIPPDGRWVHLHGDLARGLLPLLRRHRGAPVERPALPGEAQAGAAPEEEWGRSTVEGLVLVWCARTVVVNPRWPWVSIWTRKE